ncbi:MAG: nucleotide exchange factor GrpE, partial [Candidatus Aminicenantes bacterium]|nr:nucleotide exchange factor GrpE [Candidatus Aminicenantes bacterium]
MSENRDDKDEKVFDIDDEIEKIREEENNSLKECLEMVRRLEKERENLERENAELLNKYLMKLADFDNFKKRLKKEKEEFQTYALGDFLGRLLEVVDNFERALEGYTEENPESFRDGVVLIYKQLRALLEKEGVEELKMTDEFDPNLHQAIDKEERDDIEDVKIA